MTIITAINQAKRLSGEGASLVDRIGLGEELVETLPTLYTVTVDAGVARCVTQHLITGGISFIIEPDSGDMYTIAVKVEAAAKLELFVTECTMCRGTDKELDLP